MRIKGRMNPKVLKNLADMVFVGRLTDASELFLPFMKSSVVVVEKEKLFYLTCLSPIPLKLQPNLFYEQPIFVGYASNIKNQKIMEELGIDDEKDTELDIEERLRGKLFVFTLYLEGTNLCVELMKAMECDIERSYEFVPSPMLKGGTKKEEFEKRLLEGRLPITLMNYPNDLVVPKILYYEGWLYANVILKPTINVYSYIPQNNTLNTLDVSTDWCDMIDVEIDKHLFVVSTAKLASLQALIKEKGCVLMEENPEVMEESTELIEEELIFLDSFFSLAKQKNLHYAKKDLSNFHVCMKTGRLTLLGGLSGIGKTTLACAYGESLGLTFGEDMIVIPILPSYQEPNDLLGYLHPTTGVYYESETGLVNILLKAEKNPNQLHMVIFDEMNLSKIEHWFSPFMSVLELGDKRRILSLFHENNYFVNKAYKPTVEIGNNVLFVGTVNLDDTTTEMSSRLLDRMNMVLLSQLPFSTYEYSEDMTPKSSYQLEHRIFIEEWRKTSTGLKGLRESELQFFDELHCLINNQDSYLGISYRVVSSISSYLLNLPSSIEGIPVISREEAFDLQMKQRILTKIKGTTPTIELLVGNAANNNGLLIELFTSLLGQSISSFEQSIQHVKQKAKEWELYGYVR